MTSFYTEVSHAGGPVNMGSGNQNNLYISLAETFQRLGTHGKDRRAIAEQELNWLHQRFIPPDRFGRARGLLRDHRTVIVSGQSGNGRRTAALMLLYELAEDGAGMHEIDPGRDEDGPILDRQAVGDGDRLLLDLSGSDSSRYLGVQKDLSAFRSVVEDRDARLVVVLPPHLKGHLAAELQRLTVEIGRPRGDELLMRYLRRDRIIPSPTELLAPSLADYLASKPMRDLARLANLIGRNRDSTPAGGFSEWWNEALAQLTDDGSETATFIAELNDGRRRALALTVAMFHGSAPDTINQAVMSLLAQVSHPEDDRPRLDRSDLTTELHRIGASAGAEGRVRFDTVGRDRAVLTHFWTYFPDLRPGFRAWVGECGRNLRLDGEERRDLIARFAEQTLRADLPEELLSLAREWTQRGDAQRLLPDAAQVLAEGLRHDLHGRVLRQRILDLVKEPELPRTFRLALTLVCSQVMAVRHPDEAVTRLHHLARREATLERRPAWDALLTLAVSERRLCALLLHRLTRYGSNSPGSLSADSRIFLALADSVSRRPDLCAGYAIRERLTAGWATVLEHGPHEDWAPHVEHWLEAARATDGQRDRLLATLAESGAHQPGAIGRMYVISQRWARTSTADRAERRLVADHFRRSLDAAQGIEPPTATAAPADQPAPEAIP
ncbi:ABC transporter substrate-binding protein [Streptomyces litchfieldiae]|uniref:ABC transporter substrate-binding protein n=1 Tax=Streptomyces litchfieldiae TaxID=3075543 RepID=A0ABU2MS13_9ACTN|nr:ABC transporter substrate-binding protein [Streptomyces sp. DSM 44938]MDT0344417.1 ABC transporter substrate-binding protein [Streptomyces sp. DSM 44938]